jgi:hypothetical protein
LSDSLLNYTHWAYFPDRASAEACAAEFTSALDCLVELDPPHETCDAWQMRATRSFPHDELEDRHAEAERIVEKHGGRYDGGESTWSVRRNRTAPAWMRWRGR